MTQNPNTQVISVICCRLSVLSLFWRNTQTVSYQASGRPTVSSCSLGTQAEVEFIAFRDRRAQISALLCCSPSLGILTGGNLLLPFILPSLCCNLLLCVLDLGHALFQKVLPTVRTALLAPELQLFCSDLSFVSLLHPPVTQ